MVRWLRGGGETMRTLLIRLLGGVPSAEVRRIVRAHNNQRAEDDAVYAAQTAEIARLGRMLAERKAENLRLSSRYTAEVMTLVTQMTAIREQAVLERARCPEYHPVTSPARENGMLAVRG